MVSVFEKYRSSVLFGLCKRNNSNTMGDSCSRFVDIYALLMFLIRRNPILNHRWPEEKLGSLRFTPRNVILRKLQSVFFMATINSIREALNGGYLEDREIRTTVVCALEARKRSAGQYAYYNEEEEEEDEKDSEFVQSDGAIPGSSRGSIAPLAVPAASSHHHRRHHRYLLEESREIHWSIQNTSDADEEFTAIFDTPRRRRWLNEQARARMLEDSSSDSSSDASFASTTSYERERIEAASRKIDEELDIEILVDELMAEENDNDDDDDDDEYNDEDDNDEYNDEDDNDEDDNDNNHNDEDRNDGNDGNDVQEILMIFGGAEE